MFVLDMLRNVTETAGKIIRIGAGLQNSTRKELVDELQTICSKCDDAYSTVLGRLHPLTNAYGDRGKFSRELNDFAADPEIRRVFKPEQLCGDVDRLLDRLRNNLDPLKYSIDIRKIDSLRQALQQLGNYDSAIRESYELFTQDLARIGIELRQLHGAEATKRMEYARTIIDDFQNDLFSTVRSVRDAKKMVLG